MKGFVIAYVVFFSAVIINSVWACEDLAGTDYCTKYKGACDDPNYQFFKDACSLTCGVCKGWECVDLKYADYCTAYKDKCDTEPQVKADCPKTCGDCACKNRRDYCVDENKHYCDDGAFKTACPMTCGVCPQSGGPQVAPLQNEISLIGKPTSQSSTHDASQSISDHAVDGNTNGYYFSDSCTHTAFNNVGNPWWAVDMQQDECVEKVVLYNRADCCEERLEGAIVRVGSNPDYGQNPECESRVSMDQISSASPGDRIEIECNLSGQYISVELPRRDLLTLCEVKATSCSGNDKRMSEETRLLKWLKRELETDSE